MRLHPRTEIVSSAERDLEGFMLGLLRKYDLTFVEVFAMLGQQISRNAKWALRQERHGDNPDGKGGDAA